MFSAGASHIYMYTNNIHISNHTVLGRSMNLAQISYVDSTAQDEQNNTEITFIAPSKLKLLAIKDICQILEKFALL